MSANRRLVRMKLLHKIFPAAAWGVFVKLNRSAEEIEPEAMKAAKEEDRKVDNAKVTPGKL